MQKIVFMGTPEFAVPSLKKLAEHFNVVAVYSQMPRPSGRGHHVQKSPVHLAADIKNIPVKTPKNFKNKEDVKELAAFAPDYIVVVAYGLILPEDVLNIAPCINIHASLLPRWRGAAPIHRAIEAGDKKTGITTMFMEKGLDTGDMLLKEEINITPDMTGGSLHDLLMDMGANLIIKTINGLDQKIISPEKQGDGATYASKIEKSEALIDWKDSAESIERKIRAFNPYPAASFSYNGEIFKIFSAEIVEAKGKPGQILDDKLLIACGNGAIRPKIIQRQGKKPVTLKEMLNGYKFSGQIN